MQSTYSTSRPSHVRQSSYSIFPSSKKEIQPTSVYGIGNLAPPPTIHFNENTRHKRNSSIDSSGTLQIGIRVSQASPLPATTYNSTPNNIALPPTTYRYQPALPLPTSSFATNPAAASSNLRVQTNFNQTPSPPVRSTNRPAPSPLDTSGTVFREEGPTRVSPSVNKTLPPTPKYSFPAIEKLRTSTTQLSPAVYSPDKKLAAPGLGSLGSGPRSVTSPRSNPLRANPMDRTNSGSVIMPPMAKTKENRTSKDWI